MVEPIKSAWGVVYYVSDEWPKFLIIKRYALSKKVEWVAPKWKIQSWESSQIAAVREIFEETWLKKTDLIIKQELWEIQISLRSEERWNLDKDIVFFLVEYKGNPADVKIPQWEWYLWYYKWANIQEVLWLIYYENLRELFRKAYYVITDKK